VLASVYSEKEIITYFGNNVSTEVEQLLEGSNLATAKKHGSML